jgi:hypothetical protein
MRKKLMQIVPKQDNPSVLEITLKNGQTCQIDESDFNDLMDTDIPSEWSIHLGYVVAKRRENRWNIARLIRDAGKGTKIVYADGNKMNLRRNNLIVDNGAAEASPKLERN